MMALLLSSGEYPAPPVCPVAPFDPSGLALSAWFEATDCPGSGLAWLGKASAGTSGNIEMVGHSGAGPMGLAKPPSVAPCGLQTAEFGPSPYSVAKTIYNASYPVMTGVESTMVFALQFFSGVTSIYGPEYNSAIYSDFSANYRLWINASGAVGLSTYNGSGFSSPSTGALASGDWAIVVAQCRAGDTRIRVNRGAWSTVSGARVPTSPGDVYYGVDASLGAQVEMNAACIYALNYEATAGEIADLEARCEWYIGTTV